MFAHHFGLALFERAAKCIPNSKQTRFVTYRFTLNVVFSLFTFSISSCWNNCCTGHSDFKEVEIFVFDSRAFVRNYLGLNFATCSCSVSLMC